MTEHEFEMKLGNLLRTGVGLAAAVVIVGGAIYLNRHGAESPAYHTFHSEPARLRSLKGVLESCLQLSGRGIIQLGLLLLIATPIARVAFAAYGFLRQRDWMYVAISSFVLTLLLGALLKST